MPLRPAVVGPASLTHEERLVLASTRPRAAEPTSRIRLDDLDPHQTLMVARRNKLVTRVAQYIAVEPGSGGLRWGALRQMGAQLANAAAHRHQETIVLIQELRSRGIEALVR